MCKLKRLFNYCATLFNAPHIFANCPRCGQRHVDLGEWALRPHRTHLCLGCGAKWVPFQRPTVAL
jgi:hypothetical protein